MNEVKRMHGKSLILLMAAVLPLLLSCGREDKVSASDGSTIQINMTDVSFNLFAPTCPSGVYNDVPVDIVVRDAFDNVMPNTIIYINLTFSPYSADSSQWYWFLYDDSIPRAVPYQANTGDFGTKHITLRLDRGCSATGYIEVFSGTAYAKTDISMM